MFEQKRQVEYSQLTPDKSVGVADILRYFQDAAVAHTTACGYSLDRLTELKRAWILLSMRIQLEKPIQLLSNIKICTWTYEFARAYGPRAFEVVNVDNGEVYARAAAMWAFVDAVTGRPKEIPEDMLRCFGNGTPATLPYIRRAPNYEADKHIADFRVLKRDLDTNLHVNNVKYVEYALESVPEKAEISEIEIYYKHAMFYNDIISLYASSDEAGNILTNLKNKDGETCTYIKFILNGMTKNENIRN